MKASIVVVKPKDIEIELNIKLTVNDANELLEGLEKTGVNYTTHVFKAMLREILSEGTAWAETPKEVDRP